MAKGVIDRLEVVGVDEQAGQRPIVTLAAGEVARRLVVKGAAAQSIGEAIGGRKQTKFQFVNDQPGEVSEHFDLFGGQVADLLVHAA